ncbi:MAG: hypothetical protein VW802_11460 [Rhodospirillaceae bacterium]|jgi:hypothetical protein
MLKGDPGISDADIFHTASRLIERYGHDAVTVAGMRAEELLTDGNMDGYRMWKRVGMVIDDMCTAGAPEGANVH